MREQLKFLEGIDRVHTKRKQEQEREKLLKAAKVSYMPYIGICLLLYTDICLFMCALNFRANQNQMILI